MARNETDKLLEALFPEEWYIKVTKSIEFVLQHYNFTGQQAADVAKRIIDYNIEKRLDSALTESADLLLPKDVNWSDIDIQSAFEAFNALLETCDACRVLKKYSVKINFGNNNPLYNEFLLWKEVLPLHFPKLRVQLRSTKKQGIFTLHVQKITQSKSPAKG